MPEPRPVVLVTGAARRVGAAIARRLHAAGCDLVLHYRHSIEDLRLLALELEAKRADSTMILQGDLGNIPALPDMVDAAVTRFGRLDGLVNNASAFYATPLGQVTEAQWDELLSTNAKAPFFLAQAAWPHLRTSRGAIVNLLDIYGERPPPSHLAYSASKSALEALTRGLAVAMGPDVRVNGVSPGAILWPEEGKPADEIQYILDRTPLGRSGSTQEVASAVAWLLLEGGFITGEVVRIDGGRSLSF